MLPLWFKNSADYDKISGTDKISIMDLQSFKPGQDIKVQITHKDGSKETIATTSSINEGQWEWFKHGSGEPILPPPSARSRDTLLSLVPGAC